MVISIKYNEPNVNEYKGVQIGDKDFNSGDFVKDWYDMRKYLIHLTDDEWEPIMCSSSVDHFFMDGAEFDSAYLKEINDVWDLSYEHDDSCVEFFVPKGEKWTWKELRKYCKDEKLS